MLLAYKRIRVDIDTTDVMFKFMPREFTLEDVRIVYEIIKDEVVDKLSYEFEGIYNSEESAEQDNAVLHARYNIYLSQYDMDSESLTPIFQTVDNKMRIKLYLDSYGKMNSVYGKLFFIGDGSMDTIAKKSVDETRKINEWQ